MKNFLYDFFIKRKGNLVFILILFVAIALVIHTFFAGGVIKAGEDEQAVVAASNINPKIDEIMNKGAITPATEESAVEGNPAASTVTASAGTEPASASSAATSVSTAATTQPQTIPFATALPPQTPADYNAQWNAGYLIAIDNPDTIYQCSHVELSDADRDLLERLCMGEFGSGGFIGAALIAQAVKDAMCFDGYTSVQDVIENCHYDGSTEMGTTDACRQAVRYVFDHDGEAVQHRIMYMYNPYMVQSAFHESQNYILSYQGIRFFDRWGY